nr:MAG TPA: hypothetical protein [Caudoviricetes sp.]
MLFHFQSPGLALSNARSIPTARFECLNPIAKELNIVMILLFFEGSCVFSHSDFGGS